MLLLRGRKGSIRRSALRVSDKLKGLKVHVVGRHRSSDSLTQCTMIGGMTQDAPTMSVRFEEAARLRSAAPPAIVAKHLKAAGADSDVFHGELGEDSLAEFTARRFGLNRACNACR